MAIPCTLRRPIPKSIVSRNCAATLCQLHQEVCLGNSIEHDCSACKERKRVVVHGSIEDIEDMKIKFEPNSFIPSFFSFWVQGFPTFLQTTCRYDDWRFVQARNELGWGRYTACRCTSSRKIEPWYRNTYRQEIRCEHTQRSFVSV